MQRRDFIGVPLAFTAAATAAALPATARAAPVATDDYVTFEDYGALGNGVADDTVAIQAAIDDNPGRRIWATGRNYRLTSTLRIRRAVHLVASQAGTQLIMDIANKDHIAIGDGSWDTYGATFNTIIDGFTFVPGANAGISTTGSCIYVNFGSMFDIRNCDFYGAYHASQGAAEKRLFRGITLKAASDGYIRHCRVRLFRDDGIHTSGLPKTGGENEVNQFRTVDVRLESVRIFSCNGYQMYFGEHTGGMFVNDVILLDAGTRPAFCIDSDPTIDGTNFFIVNVNIEGGTACPRGLLVSRGQSVQVVGGWIGGIGVGGAAVELGEQASSCEINGLKVDYSRLLVYGPANSIKNCEISGDRAQGRTLPDGIVIGPNASDTLICANRIRQFDASAVRIEKQGAIGPARCVISGLTIHSVPGEAGVVGGDYRDGPAIEAIRSDVSAYANAAAQLQLGYGREVFQVNGPDTIQDIVPRNPGRRITIQAGLSGIGFAGNGILQLKGGAASATVPPFRTIEFVSDGSNWFESGGSR